jgi:Ni/Co efflux regulator RcnB
MKSSFITLAAAALIFAASSAYAAPDQKDRDHQAGGAHGGGHAVPAQHAAPAAPTHFTHTEGMNHGMHGTPTPMQSHNTMSTSHSPVFNTQTRGTDRDRNATRNYNTNNNRSYSNNRGGGHANFNRRNVTAQHHYHYRGGAYRGPSGYVYRRWAYGDMLPSIYWGRDYWIDDYSDYGLADPPPGCVWVRYGNDAVLIDEDSGEILEIVYDQFY